MTPEAIGHYLKQHPEFFEEQREGLSTGVRPHPHGGRAIPLVERQLIGLRDKQRLLESKLGELVSFGEENDAISEKVHRLALALLGAGSSASTKSKRCAASCARRSSIFPSRQTTCTGWGREKTGFRISFVTSLGKESATPRLKRRTRAPGRWWTAFINSRPRAKISSA